RTDGGDSARMEFGDNFRDLSVRAHEDCDVTGTDVSVRQLWRAAEEVRDAFGDRLHHPRVRASGSTFVRVRHPEFATADRALCLALRWNAEGDLVLGLVSEDRAEDRIRQLQWRIR